MKIGEKYKGCEHWGYDIASAEDLHKPMNVDLKTALRNKHAADRLVITRHGFKPVKYGYRARIAAIGAASRIERHTGIEMRVFSHSYM